MSARTTPAVDSLPRLAGALLARATGGGAAEAESLRIVQLRRKPGRGLTALLVAQAGRRRPGPGAAPVWLRLEESALSGSAAAVTRAEVLAAPLRGTWPGSLHTGDVGVSLETAGTDAGLPALAAACSPVSGTPLWAALEDAARRQLADPAARLTAAHTVTVRHKPGSRCVLRYDLTLSPGGGDPGRVTLFGKLFAEPAHAVAADALLRGLHAEQQDGGEVIVPRPLGVVEQLGLALTAAVAGEGTPPVSGVAMLRSGTRQRGEAGDVGAEALTAAARALAVLHSSGVRPPGGRGTGVREARSVAGRVALLAGHAPALAARLGALGDELSTQLTRMDGAAAAPAHGGYKPSQLVYTGARRVVVTDFDGFCLADPALDVGYFLAYLRPATLWRRGEPGRAWFAAAAGVFTAAYAAAMAERGAPPSAVASTLRRAPLHEAAALLKIAGRRPHRCNAPRAAELAAMLREIEGCLARSPSSAIAVPGLQGGGSSWSPAG